MHRNSVPPMENQYSSSMQQSYPKTISLPNPGMMMGRGINAKPQMMRDWTRGMGPATQMAWAKDNSILK